MVDFDSPTGELEYFLDYNWGGAEGYVYMPIRDAKHGTWKKIFFEWPLHRDDIIKMAIARSAQGYDVFCAPALFKTPNPGKDNVKGSNVLWAEFDGNAPPTWGDGSNGSEDGAQRLWKGIPEPSMRVQSSTDGHQHVYWRLENFCDDVRELEQRNRSIAYTLRSDVSGWDCNQILRPPGTINYKKNLPVALIGAGNQGKHKTTYSLGVFSSLPRAEQIVNESINTENLPALELVVAKYPWDEEHYSLLVDSSIEQGKRSDALMRLAYFGAEVGMSEEEIYVVVENADSRWKKYTERSDRKRRLVDIINRAKLKYPVALDRDEFKGLEAAEEIEVDSRLYYGFDDFNNSKVVVEWAVEDLLDQTGFGIVSADPGTGKTLFSLQMAMSLALGRDFLKWKVPKPQKLVWFSLEMSHPSLKRFTTKMATAYTPDELKILQENLIVVPIGEAILLDTPQGLRFMESILSDIQPDGIMIDSMGKLSNDELNEKSVKVLNNRYIRLRKKFGCWIWFVHHNRKGNSDNKKPTDLSDLYGSTYVAAEVTSALILWRTKDRKQIHCIPVKQRLSEPTEPFVLKRSPEDLHYTVSDEKLKEDMSTIESLISGEIGGEEDADPLSPFNFK